MPSQAARALCRRRRGVLSPLPLPPAPTPCAPVRHRRARWRTHLHHNHRDHRGIGARVRPGSPTMTGQCEKSTHGRSEINREIRYETTWDTTSAPMCGPRMERSHLCPEVLAQGGLCCPTPHRLATSSASLDSSASLPGLAGYRHGLRHSRVILPAPHTFRTFTAVLSRIAAFSFRREPRYVHPSSSVSTLAIR